MAAAKLNLKIAQGATFLRTLTIQDSSGNPINITGWTFDSEIKDRIGGTLLGTFSFVILDQGTNLGQVTMNLTPAQTKALISGNCPPDPCSNGQYNFVYDMFLTTLAPFTYKALYGSVTVYPEVTTS